MIKKISDKRKLRLAWYSEKDLFTDLHKTRPKRCMICWCWTELNEGWCYAHILDKWMRKKYRTDQANIATICTPICHNYVDYLAKWYGAMIEEMIEKWRTAQEIILYLKSQKES